MLTAVFIATGMAAARGESPANVPVPPPLLYSAPLDEISDATPRIRPWISVPLDALYQGMWIVAGDLGGDGEAELVSARIHDVNDVHHTVSVVAQRLDGSVLWRWGEPEKGVFPLHSDVACQIYDWDGDGQCEVIVAADRAVVELDGATGREKRRFAIPPDASDCIVFCNLTGGPQATDVLVKTRYSHIWAYDRHGKALWSYRPPDGYRTAHQPRPIDIDGDGVDEIVDGFVMLDADGSERWALRADDPALARWKPLVEGHLDCARLLARGTNPADSKIAITFCGAERMALLRGTGEVIWSVYGKHFESIDVGKVCRHVEGRQIVVDVPYAPRGNQPLCIFDERGRLLGEIIADYSRMHRLVDWHGDGVESIVLGSPPTLYDGETGKRLAIFDMPGGRVETRSKEEVPYLCSTGDMTDDGVADVLFLDCARGIVHVYKNERGRPLPGPVPLGTGVNWTLY
jgi:hypothetical protein